MSKGNKFDSKIEQGGVSRFCDEVTSDDIYPPRRTSKIEQFARDTSNAS